MSKEEQPLTEEERTAKAVSKMSEMNELAKVQDTIKSFEKPRDEDLANEKKTLGVSVRDVRMRSDRQVEQMAQETEEEVNQKRDPAMIEAEAVKKIADAMHDPDRKQALLHSNIQKGNLAPVGEMEMIERAAKVAMKRQVEILYEMLKQKPRVAQAEMESFEKRLDVQREKVEKNGINLRGMMMGGNEAFELAFSAYMAERAKHGTQNIASVVSGSKNVPDFEAEKAKSFWKKISDRARGGGQ